MSFDLEKRNAAHLLAMVENGSHSTSQMTQLYEDADPALIYLLFAWLRARYLNHSAAEGVFGRIMDLCQSSPIVARKLKAGEQDAIVRFFEESYDYRDVERDEFISVIVEKLEG